MDTKNKNIESNVKIQYVTKRSGKLEVIDPNKIYQRIKNTIEHKPELDLSARDLTKEVIKVLEPNIKTNILDEETCKICATKIMIHPHFRELASRIIISNHHKNTRHKNSSFSNTMKQLYERKNQIGKPWPAINSKFYKFVVCNDTNLNKIIHLERDYRLDYFGFKTLERAYLLKGNNDIVIERPQDMYLRIAVALHMPCSDNSNIYNQIELDDIALTLIKETYNVLSLGLYSHASPTLFNGGTNREQFASCFLAEMGDSAEEIMRALSKAAIISSASGGMGMHVSTVRARGSSINKTNGRSSGPLPFLQIANQTMRAFNQGGKRPGSMAVFIEPWHADIIEIINARRPHIEEKMRAKDLFYALWIPDLFITQIKENGDWWLMCPKDCPGLTDVYGDQFEKLYMSYVIAGMYKTKIKSHDLWREILNILIETGIPYIGFKDHVNRKTNQQNIGTIKSSNLCMEIMEYSDTTQYAVCVLSSIAVQNYVITAEFEGAATWEEYCNCISYNKIPDDITAIYDRKLIMNYSNFNNFYSEESFNAARKSGKMIDHVRLFEIVVIIINNLNIVIDKNEYPNNETKISNMLHRPLGIGIQGLADLFFKLKLPFDSKEAAQINIDIFETMYFAALWGSSLLAKEKFKYNIVYGITVNDDPYFSTLDDTFQELLSNNMGEEFSMDGNIMPGYYPSFKANGGCPYSKGIMQYHLWGWKTSDLTKKYNWFGMEQRVKTHGLRNSQLLALMPTASTSQILGNNECFEPKTSNIYTRKTIAGEFVIGNKYLIDDLHNKGLLSTGVIDNIIQHDGSVAYIHEILGDKANLIDCALYKTAWELKMKSIIDMAADRGIFIDQSQSMNLWIAEPTIAKLSSMYIYAYDKGLKTGGYYLRTRSSARAQQYYSASPQESNVPGKKWECTETDGVCSVCT